MTTTTYIPSSKMQLATVSAHAANANGSKNLQPTLNKTIRAASRSSALALVQVKEIFEKLPDTPFEIVRIDSLGDKRKDISLINNTISDIFTRELDFALLNGEADIAIHSAKDLPNPLPKGLEVIALTKSEDSSDSLVSRENKALNDLPANSKIGTSSAQRKAELLKLRADLEIVSIRGTIEERIALVDNGTIDALIVATCALKRLNLQNRIAEVLPFETHPLQGNLAVVAKTGNKELKQIFSSIDSRKDYGKVQLVGFGPGNPDLLTIRGYELLKKADIIIHDDLIDIDFLNEFKAEKIYVGKRKNNHSHEQEAINRLLLTEAIKGKNTVRLKGGDPMIFAHGGEEISYLKQNFVEVSVVPGITSALAAAALAQIPLTHRDLSSSVTFISGHNIDKIDFSVTGTNVIYMGASNLHAIAGKAISCGLKPQTPVLLISNISKKEQESNFSTLEELMNTKKEYTTPLLAVIGDVVGLQSPVNESVIWATGTDFVGLKNYNVLHSPLIEINPLDDYSDFQNTLNELQLFDWIIFTSKHAVHHFFEQLSVGNRDARSLQNIKIASIGSTTTNELKIHGLIPDIQPSKETSEGLLEEFKNKVNRGAKILIPRSNLGSSILPEGLYDYGFKVIIKTLYNNTLPSKVNIPNPNQYDAVFFTSPSCVQNFIHFGQEFLPDKKYIATGDHTFYSLIRNGAKPSQIYTKENFETSMFYI